MGVSQWRRSVLRGGFHLTLSSTGAGLIANHDFENAMEIVDSPMSMQIVIFRMETDLNSTYPLQSSQYSYAHEITASLPRNQIAGSDI